MIDVVPRPEPVEQLARPLDPIADVVDAEELDEQVVEQLRLLLVRRHGFGRDRARDGVEDGRAAEQAVIDGGVVIPQPVGQQAKRLPMPGLSAIEDDHLGHKRLLEGLDAGENRGSIIRESAAVTPTEQLQQTQPVVPPFVADGVVGDELMVCRLGRSEGTVGLVGPCKDGARTF